MIAPADRESVAEIVAFLMRMWLAWLLLKVSGGGMALAKRLLPA
jgi:hypothetical protein